MTDEHGPDIPDQGTESTTRKYLPTLSDLIDRMSICQLKAIFIPEAAAAYHAEIDDLVHDVDLELKGKTLDARAVRAILLIMLANRFIWENESKARAGGPEQDKLLKLTHSVNGVRNRAKNELAAILGGRKDLKTDCLASDLPPEFGNWDVFK